MCFILITLNDQGKKTKAPDIIEQKERLNSDGTGILTPHDGKINRALEASAEAIRRTENAKMAIAHLRMATTGNVSQQNVHLWQKKNSFFAHNGIVTKYSNYEAKLPANKDKNSHTDSYLFFETVTDYISDDEVDTEAISLEAAEAGLGGRFLISQKDKTYLFGDWEVVAYEGVTYITSAVISISETQWQHGIPFNTSIPAWESSLDGVFVIDHETLTVTYLHENAKKSYAKPVYTGSNLIGFHGSVVDDGEQYDYMYGGVQYPKRLNEIGQRSQSKFND